MKAGPRSNSALQRKNDCIALLVADLIFSGLNTEMSNAARHASHEKLLEMDSDFDPGSYSCASRFFDDYIVVSLLSKFPNLDVRVDREKVALEKFVASEDACRQTDIRIRALRRGEIHFLDPLHAVFHGARRKIQRTLGNFSWDESARSFSFGPGASIGIRRREGDAVHKFGHLRPTVTQECAALAHAAVCSVPRWKHRLERGGTEEWFEITPGNRVTTVPKNAKTDRVIAIEPLMNMYVQKGIGRMLRQRLKRVGVDLDSQLRNQLLAQRGSVDGSLATIDLSSASDTIALSLVEDLLPADWFAALKRCRSQKGILPDGRCITYSKVSSMGNGFTFELESLIFWALSSAVLEYLELGSHDLAVYGDDIIVPRAAFEMVTHVLGFAGFKLNPKKSFHEGPFRESCGKHYFLGRDVTPLYIRKGVDSADRLLWAANSVSRLAFRCNGSGWGRDARLLETHRVIVSKLPVSLRKPSVPLFLNGDTYVDTALGGDFDEVLPGRPSNFLEGYRSKFWTREYELLSSGGELFAEAWCISRLHSLETRPPSSFLDHCGPVGRYKPGVGGDVVLPRYKWRLVKGVVPQWEDAGLWL